MVSHTDFSTIGITSETGSLDNKDEALPEVYFDWVISNYGHIDADKLQGKGQAIPLKLPEIFIPLYAHQTAPGPSRKTYLSEEKQKPVDIEKIIAKNDVLLIEGQAGSGKTTLLKHLAYCLARPNSKDFLIEGLDNFLPVLILLKSVEEFFHDPEQKQKKGFTAEDILEWYLKTKMGNTLHLATIQKLLKIQKVIFLFDGLDESSPDWRDMVVSAFSDLIIRNKGNHLVFTGRPHGLEGEVVKKYGSKQVRILSLTMEQVNLFIKKWFTYLYSGSLGLGGKNAEAMIGEIKDHPAIDQLIDNPLMLTAICILYHDGKELPGQRAELYKKFIDNLLYRRFKDPEMVHDFLKTLAFEMQEQNARSIDRAFAAEILKSSYKMRADETKKEWRKRLEKVFDDIEPKCGLLKFENGQYTFWHLTFQEFLAAHYLVDNHTDYDQAIKSYWDEERYKEVVELFIGYLSMENKKWANRIISQALQTADKSPFKRWRLASCSLVDMHRKRREEPVLALAKKRLLLVMDTNDTPPKDRADAGETLGWLGDPRNVKEFVKVKGGSYKLEGFGAVSITPFEISKYPVTNSWFEEFIKAGGYKNKDLWTPRGRKWLEYTKTKYPDSWNARKWHCPNLAKRYVMYLNQKKFKGYDDWRLPTIPELMSLLSPEKGPNGLYINPVFDAKQHLCWSADQWQGRRIPSAACFVYFNFCEVSWDVLYHGNGLLCVRP